MTQRPIRSRKNPPAGLRSSSSIARIRSGEVAYVEKKAACNCSAVNCCKSRSFRDNSSIPRSQSGGKCQALLSQRVVLVGAGGQASRASLAYTPADLHLQEAKNEAAVRFPYLSSSGNHVLAGFDYPLRNLLP